MICGQASLNQQNMSDIKNLTNENKIHRAFEISLSLKGLFALGEIIGGIVAFFVTKEFLLRTVSVLTQEELSEDPRDLLADYLLHSAQNLSLGTQLFVASYLLSHGSIKLWLIIGLLRQKLWYYPTAIIVFGLFIIYQLYRFSFTHSVWLLLTTVIDVMVIALTWHEYKYLRWLLHRPN
jgi:uncharacterized membrane protein